MLKNTGKWLWRVLKGALVYVVSFVILYNIGSFTETAAQVIAFFVMAQWFKQEYEKNNTKGD